MRAHLLAVLALLLIPLLAGAEPPAGPTPLTLGDLLRAALAYDGRIMAAAADLESYRAKYDEAQRSWFPQIKLQVLFGGPVSERRLACNPPSDECLKVTSSSDRGNWNLGQVGFAVGGQIEGVLPLYTFGKISAAKDAASAGVRGGEAGLARARQDVALEVRRAYYGWLLANAAVEILDDGQDKLADAEKKLRKMLENNNEEVSDRDLYKLRYYASQVDGMMIQARQGQEITLAALRFLTGLDGLGADLPLAVIDLEAPDFPVESRDACLARAAQLRPELRMLRAARAAASAAVDLQEASFYPDFFIGGYVKGSYSNVQDFIKNPLLSSGLTYYDAGLALGLQVTLDIPQKLARLDGARADFSRVCSQARQAEEAVGLELDKKLSDLRSAKDNAEALRKGQHAAKAWLNANLMDYGVGISNTKDLLDSLAAHAKSQMDLDKAAQDQLVAIDQLKAAIGDDLGRWP